MEIFEACQAVESYLMLYKFKQIYKRDCIEKSMWQVLWRDDKL